MIGVGTVIALGLAGLFVYLLLAAFQGDSAHYGSVPIPSEDAPIELPSGETDIYYAEPVDQDVVGDLTPPTDLVISVAGPNGEGVRIDDRGGDTKATDDGSARLIAAALLPGEGTYTVTVTSSDLAGRRAPAITFGQSPLGAVGDRFDDVVAELDGPTGIVVLAVLGVLFLAPRVGRALER